MVGTSVMTSYLIAAKSLHHHLRRGRMVVMDDGTLTEQDRALLRHHLGDPQILSLADVDVGPCPRGGTWERLLTILDIAADDYVIQLDSDTVTIGPVPHIEEAIDANRCFTLLGAETPARTIMDVHEFQACSFPDGEPTAEDREGHIQGATESVLTRLAIEGLDRPRYVRGCSGFAGFARGSNRRLAMSFSQAAGAILGADRWKEWGTEQITSNFVIANSDDAVVLPPSSYENYWGTPSSDDVRFLHFIGTYRWHAWEYQRRSLAAIKALDRAAGEEARAA
ncbi:hypothetical protein SCLO_1022520 [Sphingobium cloacae]|uniref:Glycosyltransferase n=1 Tax=Sphingobium cloacae TaxID=120107 RepID=A0A1E1F4A7_9SPHN|nr:hypothetical protein SCLO_1022520 [Sphingobium cloacae]